MGTWVLEGREKRYVFKHKFIPYKLGGNMSDDITHEQARESMFAFIRGNIGRDNLREEGNYFYGGENDRDFVLRLVDKPVRRAQDFVDEVVQNAGNGVATGIIMLRSTTHYHGDLFKQLVYDVEGKNYFWNREKNLTTFEQGVLRLYGNTAAYYNPQEDVIQIVHTRRFHKIPEYLASKTPEELAADSDLRHALHKQEGLRRAWRMVWFSDEIDGYFTLVDYERKTKPLVALVRGA